MDPNIDVLDPKVTSQSNESLMKLNDNVKHPDKTLRGSVLLNGIKFVPRSFVHTFGEDYNADALTSRKLSNDVKHILITTILTTKQQKLYQTRTTEKILQKSDTRNIK